MVSYLLQPDRYEWCHSLYRGRLLPLHDYFFPACSAQRIEAAASLSVMRAIEAIDLNMEASNQRIQESIYLPMMRAFEALEHKVDALSTAQQQSGMAQAEVSQVDAPADFPMENSKSSHLEAQQAHGNAPSMSGRMNVREEISSENCLKGYRKDTHDVVTRTSTGDGHHVRPKDQMLDADRREGEDVTELREHAEGNVQQERMSHSSGAVDLRKQEEQDHQKDTHLTHPESSLACQKQSMRTSPYIEWPQKGRRQHLRLVSPQQGACVCGLHAVVVMVDIDGYETAGKSGRNFKLIFCPYLAGTIQNGRRAYALVLKLLLHSAS